MLAGEISLAEVAAAHAAALGAQIRALRLRRAVLAAVASRESSPQEMDLMHKLVTLSDAERRRFIHDFIDDTFGGVDANPAMVELLRSSMPELPEDATPDQVEAWMELVELVRDTGFRAAVRRMAEYQAAQRADGDTTGLHHDLTETVREDVGRALAAGIAPDSEQAGGIVAALTARYARTFGKADDDQLKGWILERLEVADDSRVTRYWQLVALINAWPPLPDPGPVFTWFGRALRLVSAAGTEEFCARRLRPVRRDRRRRRPTGRRSRPGRPGSGSPVGRAGPGSPRRTAPSRTPRPRPGTAGRPRPGRRAR